MFSLTLIHKSMQRLLNQKKIGHHQIALKIHSHTPDHIAPSNRKEEMT